MVLQVGFDCDDRQLDVDIWFAFWESSRSWLAERGYELYNYNYHWGDEYTGEITCSNPNVTTDHKVDHPFAFFGGDPVDLPVPPLSACLIGRIAYAQDALHRHVALKLVKENTPEYEIARHLSQDHSLSSAENFEGVLPVIDLLHLGNHKIIVMPRWGPLPHLPWFSTIREVLDFMIYLLRGVSFLHRNHIVHRDIKLANCLVNHFGAYMRDQYSSLRRNLRNDGQLVYAIIDFGLSIMFPSTSTAAELRLPSNLSWDGGLNQPHDTRQGELDYDPFAYDVGCLGVLFCKRFQYLTRFVPMLAPLLDRMTTRDINRRFTASQALEFLETFVSKLTPEELEISPPPWVQTVSYDKFNRWHGLPEEFIRTWAGFREPKPSFYVKLLRRLCEYDWGRAFVQSVRRTGRSIAIISCKVGGFGRIVFSRYVGTALYFFGSDVARRNSL